jgi:molecular chaperone DnaJ
MPKKHYTTLGLTDNASPDEINKAFKKLALKHHPDRDGGSEQQFKDINEAHAILSNPTKKKEYDMIGDNPHHQFPRTHHATNFPFHFQNAHFSNGFFNHSSKPQNVHKKKPNLQIVKHLAVSLSDAYAGCSQHITIDCDQICSCVTTCNVCNGKGIVEKHITQQLGNARFVQILKSTCTVCTKGTVVNNEECSLCQNKRCVSVKKKLELKLPPNTFHDFTTSIQHPYVSDTTIVVKCIITLPKGFQRQGNNLVYVQRISLLQSLIGSKYEVHHPSGEKIVVDYTNKNDTIKPDTCITMPGKGVHPKSNFVVKFELVFPTRRKKLCYDESTEAIGAFEHAYDKLFGSDDL